MSSAEQKATKLQQIESLRREVLQLGSFTAVNSRYAKIQRLGAGGNSEVFLVRSSVGHTAGCLFAIKVFVNVMDGTRLERFNQEVAFLRTCDHPSVLRTFDTGVVPLMDGTAWVSCPFLVTEYLPKTLRTSMLEGLPVVDKLAFALQLISGLRYLAAKDPAITHRDIKPENIFVKGKSCVLGDFGLLKSGSSDDPSTDYRVEVSTGVRFPKLYPTPDLIEYSKSNNPNPVISPKSDVFQLGLVLAELFSGVLPIASRNAPFSKIELLLDQLVVPGSQGPQISHIIKSMLEIDPVKRPTAEALTDNWEGPFREVCTLCTQLEGSVF